MRLRRESDNAERDFYGSPSAIESWLKVDLLPSIPIWSDLNASLLTLTGTEVSSWGSPIAFVGASGSRPDYIASENVARFTRANLDYLDAGSRTLAISTNGGFTAIVQMRFTGTAGKWERIFDFASGPGSNNILLARNNLSNSLTFEVYNGATSVWGYSASATGAIVQNELAIFAVRYRKSDNSVQKFLLSLFL